MIRRARPDDGAAIGRIAEKAYEVYVARLGRPPAPMIADFERHIGEDWVILFERAKTIVGYAILILDEHRALLDNIAVDPDDQGSGIGRALIEEVERQAASCGHGNLELYTNVVMTANIAWYQKLGFVETERVEECGFHRIYMSKAIGSDTDG
ncbi:MAG: GNAT family N-acetyltransferase [Alphaproteobacteria bacterium]|nr:GNAT family N-acetyltransferase [Alphaproteobacteria bacterium]